ncbi:MAG: GIY-YIG nuclease family protein, partial [Erysipelotrichales bacterium]|nr:GIY-YIG nuclease family protein [Erysipelotrichales bacterium]
MGSYCVYKHTSPSGKVYIGITRQAPESRWKNGIGYKSSPHFWSAIQKHGWENINHEIIYCGLSKEEACQKEKELIEKYNSIDRERGYNEKTGGETGVEFNESVKRKISAASRKRYEDPREREKASERARGFKHTDEAKAKMSAAKMGKHFLMTEEWKENISAANKIA